MNVQIIRSDVEAPPRSIKPVADHGARIIFGSLLAKIAGAMDGGAASARLAAVRLNGRPIRASRSRPRTPHRDRTPVDDSGTGPFTVTRPSREAAPERLVAEVVEARMRRTQPPTWTTRTTIPRAGATTSTRTSSSSNGRVPSLPSAARVGPRSRRPCCTSLTRITHERFEIELERDRAWPVGACSETPRGI